MVGNTRFHRRSDAQAGMYPAKVIVREVEGASRFQVIQFLRIAQGQTSKPFDGLPHGQVLALHVACRDVPHIGPTIAYSYYRFHHWSRRIATCCVVLSVVAKQFYHLGEVRLSGKNVFNSLPVKVEPIRGQLESVFFGKAMTECGQELIRGFAVALTYSVSRDQFCFRVNGDKYPSVADLWRIISLYVALFFPDKCPDFVALNPPALQVLHRRFHESYAALPGDDQQSENCIAVQLRDAFSAADACALYQQLNRQQRLILRYGHCAKQTDVIFRVCFSALRTPIALETVAVLPKIPAFDAALLASHALKLQQALAVCQVPKLPEKTTVTSALSRDKPQTGGVS